MRKLVHLYNKKDLSLISFDKNCLHFKYFFSRLYFGIGKGQSHRLSRYMGLAPTNSIAGFQVSTLLDLEIFIRRNFIFEKRLLGTYLSNINRLKVSKSYKGFRHKYGLPVNGQSSKNNSNNCAKTYKYLSRLYDQKYKLYRDKMLVYSSLEKILDDKFIDD